MQLADKYLGLVTLLAQSKTCCTDRSLDGSPLISALLVIALSAACA